MVLLDTHRDWRFSKNVSFVYNFCLYKVTLVYHTILYSSLCSVVLKCVSMLEHLYGHQMDIILGRE